MKMFMALVALLLSVVGLRKFGEKIDPNLDLIRETKKFKNLLPPRKEK